MFYFVLCLSCEPVSGWLGWMYLQHWVCFVLIHLLWSVDDENAKGFCMLSWATISSSLSCSHHRLSITWMLEIVNTQAAVFWSYDWQNGRRTWKKCTSRHIEVMLFICVALKGLHRSCCRYRVSFVFCASDCSCKSHAWFFESEDLLCNIKQVRL